MFPKLTAIATKADDTDTVIDYLVDGEFTWSELLVMKGRLHESFKQ